MEINKKENLIAAGFQVGSVQEFLGLTEDDMISIENKIHEHNRAKGNKKHKESHDLNHGILLDAESLLNDQEGDELSRTTDDIR